MNTEINARSYREYMEQHIQACKRTGQLTAERMANSFEAPQTCLSMLHAIVGLQSQLGDIVDIIGRHVFYGVPLDVPSILEETGDFLYYWDLLQDQLREKTCCNAINDITARDLNRKKLMLRYPNGYSEERYAKRNLTAEKALFEDAVCQDSE